MPSTGSVLIYRGDNPTATDLKRKYGFPSITVTKMARSSVPVLTEAGEYTRKSRRVGRYKRRTLRHLYNIVKQNNQELYLRWQNVNRFNSTTGGGIKLVNHLQTNATPAPTEVLPFYFFELTQCVNLDAGTTNQNPFPSWFPFRTNQAVGVYTMNVLGGINDQGGATNQWTVENSPGTNLPAGTNYPYRLGTLKYSDIRMMCYGARSVPIKYDVAIVSFPDEFYNPFYTDTGVTKTMVGVTNWATGTGANRLLDNLAAPYAGNPINIQDAKMRQYIKYHFRENFTIQPGQTTDGDQGVPHFRELRIFKKWDRMFRFDWDLTNQNNPQAPTSFETNVANNAPTPKFEQRCYLMVRATSGFTSGAVAANFDTNVNPSFDLFVRNKWVLPI